MTEKKGNWWIPENVNVTINNPGVESLRSEISGIAFALGAFANQVNKKLDAIAKKLDDPSDSELAEVVAKIKEQRERLAAKVAETSAE